MSAPGPALAVVELASLARAYVVVDALVKRARVTLLGLREVSPGKAVILFGGGEEETLEAHGAALAASATSLLDELLLAQAHPQLWLALAGAVSPRRGDAAAIAELQSVASTLRALDAACKTTDVTVVRLRLAAGIGGRGVFVLGGALDEVQAAAAAVRGAVAPERLLGCELVSRPHDEVWGVFCAAADGWDPLAGR
jgi:microcompartment protein CcmL/EutN